MSVLRGIIRCTAIRNINNNNNGLLQTQIRNYAKSKDKKKQTNVTINEQQMRELINYDAMNQQMLKIVQQMKENYVRELSLRSTTGAIETLKVKLSDGKSEHELQELAQISRKNPKVIVINLINFPQCIPDVLRAIEKSGMNINPQQDGTTLFVPIPKVTKEHRENLAKNAKALFIKYRDSLRNVQQQTLKQLKKKSDISKDDIFNVQQQVIAKTDIYIDEANKLFLSKQKELTGE